MGDLQEGMLSSELLTTLERDVPLAVDGVPRTKKKKLDEPNAQLSLLDKVTLCCALLKVLHGTAPQPRFWGTLRSGGTEHVQFVLKVGEGFRLGASVRGRSLKIREGWKRVVMHWCV